MKTRKEKGIPCSNMKEFDAVMATGPHTSMPRIDADALMVILLGNGYLRDRAAYIVRAVTAHEELLAIAEDWKKDLESALAFEAEMSETVKAMFHTRIARIESTTEAEAL